MKRKSNPIGKQTINQLYIYSVPALFLFQVTSSTIIMVPQILQKRPAPSTLKNKSSKKKKKKKNSHHDPIEKHSGVTKSNKLVITQPVTPDPWPNSNVKKSVGFTKTMQVITGQTTIKTSERKALQFTKMAEQKSSRFLIV